MSKASEYSQCELECELKSDKLEDKPLNSFFYEKIRNIKEALIKTEKTSHWIHSFIKRDTKYKKELIKTEVHAAL